MNAFVMQFVRWLLLFGRICNEILASFVDPSKFPSFFHPYNATLGALYHLRRSQTACNRCTHPTLPATTTQSKRSLLLSITSQLHRGTRQL
ncbi:hypothetical protein C8R45DRAFT_547193 [Mycena sanguinolenta]|nr:hypothetical protein C8R45DRAFT_547193 [Mycena sanguinolenta]